MRKYGKACPKDLSFDNEKLLCWRGFLITRNPETKFEEMTSSNSTLLSENGFGTTTSHRHVETMKCLFHLTFDYWTLNCREIERERVEARYSSFGRRFHALLVASRIKLFAESILGTCAENHALPRPPGHIVLVFNDN